MSLPLDSALSLAIAVPAAIAIAQGKDPATRSICALTVAVALVAALGHLAGLRMNGTVGLVVGLAVAILGAFAAVRIAKPIPSTVMLTCVAVIALVHVGAVGAGFVLR